MVFHSYIITCNGEKMVVVSHLFSILSLILMEATIHMYRRLPCIGLSISRQPLFVSLSLYISLQNAFTNMENLRILPHQLPAPGYNLSVKEFPILCAPHFGLWDLTTKTYLPLWQEIIYRSFLSFIILHFNICIPYLHTKRKPYLIQKWLMDAVIFAMI